MIALTVALFLTTAGFFLADMFKKLLLKYTVILGIPIAPRIVIDFYGTIVPTVFSLLFIFYLICLRKFSLKRYLSYFFLSLCLAGVFSIASHGGMGFYYILLALLIGFLVISITFYDGGLPNFLMHHDLQRLKFTKRNYSNALLIAFSYASLSVLIFDLIYALSNAYFSTTPNVSITTYIGGMGLADVTILSGLCACLGVTFASLCIMLIYEDMYHK